MIDFSEHKGICDIPPLILSRNIDWLRICWSVLQVPDWADVVKLGVNRQLAPVDPDWYFVRAASVARHLYFRSPVGKAL